MLVGLVAVGGLVVCTAPAASADLPAPLPEVLPDEVEEPLEPVTDLLPWEEEDAEKPDPVAPPPVVKLPRTPSTATPPAVRPAAPARDTAAPRREVPAAPAVAAPQAPVTTEIEYSTGPVEYATASFEPVVDRAPGSRSSDLPWLAVAVATTAAAGAGTWQVAEVRRRR